MNKRRTTDATDLKQPARPDVARLARLIRAHCPHDGRFDVGIKGLRASRYSRVSAERTYTAQRPVLCVVAQGAKSLILGQEIYTYDASRMLIVSVDLPVAAQVVRASPAEPFLGLVFELDPAHIAELALKVFPQGLPPGISEGRGVYVSPPNASIIDAATRLIGMAGQPGEAELLAPLVIDEILIRVLRSPLGIRLAQIGLTDSSMGKVANAIAWLRDHYAQPMKVEELADRVHMSPSSFHQHFKAVTSMSPLNYQKVLRLQEARRLMLSTMKDASSASRQVGYISASQFSREYARFFGSAPTRDIARLTEQGLAGSEIAH